MDFSGLQWILADSKSKVGPCHTDTVHLLSPPESAGISGGVYSPPAKSWYSSGIKERSGGFSEIEADFADTEVSER